MTASLAGLMICFLPLTVMSKGVLKENLRALAGEPLAPAQFAFSTGGPAVVEQLPSRYEAVDEEQVFILEGQVTLRLGDETHEMRAGDYVCFPAGQKAGHCFVNNGSAVCRFLVIGEKNPNEVCVYTDSNKVLVRSFGRREIYDRAALRDYWDGEKTER